MQVVKTAISMEKGLFEQAERMAKEMNVSRSGLFVLALKEFIEHQRNRELLCEIDEAYGEEPDDAEKRLRGKARRGHRRIVEGEW